MKFNQTETQYVCKRNYKSSITSFINIATSSYTRSLFPHLVQLLDLFLTFREEFGLLVLLGITVRTQQRLRRYFHEHSVKTDYTLLSLLASLLPRRDRACKYEASVKIWVHSPAFCAQTRPPCFSLPSIIYLAVKLYTVELCFTN